MPFDYRTYEHDGVLYREWAGVCAGEKGDGESAPFMQPCATAGDPVYCTTIGEGDVRYVLCYCPAHLDQHPSVGGDT